MVVDKLTQDFFNNDHPGWDYSKPVDIPKNPFFTKVPFVELDFGLDLGYINQLCTAIAQDIPREEIRIDAQYQKNKRIVGWEANKLLWNHKNRSTHITDIRSNIYADELDAVLPDEHEKKLEDYLVSKGIHYKISMLMQLIPGNSYLRPHRDISDNWPLLYIWIPVKYPVGSELRFYPYGTVPVKLGKAYLFNQHQFVHAIRNTNNTETRYIVAGHTDQKIMDTEEFRNKVTQAINQQYNNS